MINEMTNYTAEESHYRENCIMADSLLAYIRICKRLTPDERFTYGITLTLCIHAVTPFDLTTQANFDYSIAEIKRQLANRLGV